MLRDVAVDLVKARLARGKDTTLTDLIVKEMQLLQMRLEGDAFLPWFLLHLDTGLATVNGQDYLATPTGFLREMDEDIVTLVDSWGNRRTLRKADPSDMSAQPGMPTHYSLIGASFYFSPVPDAVYSLRLRYYKKALTLETNIENAWLADAADLMIAETGWTIAQKYLRDKEMAKSFGEDTIIARTRLRAFNQSRLDAAREYRDDD